MSFVSTVALSPTQLILWAAFEPPPEYLTYARSLFSYQIIPSLGTAEKQEADRDKLEALEDTLSKSFKEGRNKDERNKDEAEKERKKLLKCLALIYQMDRNLSLINSRRNQYQRG